MIDAAIVNLRNYMPEYPDKQPSMMETYTEAAQTAMAEYND